MSKPNPFAFQILYPSACSFVFLCFYSIFFFLVFLLYLYCFCFFMYSVSVTSLAALYNHKFYAIFFLFSAQSYSSYIIIHMLWTHSVFYVFFGIVCIAQAKAEVQYTIHSTTWPAVDLWITLSFSLVLCLFTFSMCRHRFPFKSIKIKLHIHNKPKQQNYYLLLCIRICIVCLAFLFMAIRYSYLFSMNDTLLLSSQRLAIHSICSIKACKNTILT